MIEPRLFNPFSSEKIHLLFCSNTYEPPVPLRHNHYVPLIICSQKKKKKKKLKTKTKQKSNLKNKGNRKHKLSLHLTITFNLKLKKNLQSKKPCGQSSIKAFFYIKVYPKAKVS